VAYELDSAMIEFGTALDELDLARAIVFLEQSEQRGLDVLAMWRQLADVALDVCRFLALSLINYHFITFDNYPKRDKNRITFYRRNQFQ
jgi:hypothetical protein